MSDLLSTEPNPRENFNFALPNLTTVCDFYGETIQIRRTPTSRRPKMVPRARSTFNQQVTSLACVSETAWT